MAKKAVAKKTGGQINSGQINSGKMYRWQNVVVVKCQWPNVKWRNYSGELSVTPKNSVPTKFFPTKNGPPIKILIKL